MSKETRFQQKLEQDLAALKQASPKPCSPEMEHYLATGYQRIKTRKHAEELIKKFEAGGNVPYDVYEDALAFIEALDAKPSAKNIYHPPTNFRGEIVDADSPVAL